jgi:predicted metal-binding membrane protein
VIGVDRCQSTCRRRRGPACVAASGAPLAPVGADNGRCPTLKDDHQEAAESISDANGTLALVARQRGGTIWLLGLALLGWVFLAWIAFDMGSPFAQLTMPESSRWSAANALAVWVMWAVMMAAMMLPSALPMILTFVEISARTGDRMRGRSFVAAYLAIWFAFSVGAAALQWLLQSVGWLNPMIVSTSALLTGALLLIAGAYQFSPLKRMCLSHCRTPMGFLLGEWRGGVGGAFRMGLRHGLFCVGCCWALMALLFVGGVMNLAWIAALSIGVALEKMLPGGERVATALGLVLLAAGAVKLFVVWS